MPKLLPLSGLVILGALSTSCASVAPYDKAHLNDAEMELAARATEKFEKNFLLYREASSGANGGKNGGGCGCN